MSGMNGREGSADQGQRYYGKYRGTVINNVDPLQIGRIQAIVTDVSALLPTTYAMPCVPLAGKEMGTYMVPQVGAGVWIEFEQGNPDYPIWVGTYWGTAAEVPKLALAGIPASPNIVFQTAGQNTLMLSDTPGVGIVLKTLTGAFIMVNDVGITISNGKGAIITMTGNITDINGAGLTVI
ncbi:phage baseplate assembly protein V [Pendulispora rubella]|uniref:Phage baseplate assembly protein V n=1 Tax=Pendulispora rubella TaxID=2741070 RepID=A0ABZ2LI70_9BACT